MVLIEKTLNGAAFIAYMGLAYNILTPAKSISKASYNIKRGNAAAERVLEILEQEKSFELDLENNVVMKGRIDQINSLGRKDVEIVDYKTGKPRKDSDAKKDLQLSIYAIAVKEILELNPVRLVFHYLQNNQRQETTRDAKQLDEAQKMVQETAAAIRAGEFAAKPGFQCRSCAYRPICPGHEEALISGK